MAKLNFWSGTSWVGVGSDVISINGKTGAVTLTASDVGAISSVNGKSGASVSLSASDVGAIPTTDVYRTLTELPAGGDANSAASKFHVIKMTNASANRPGDWYTVLNIPASNNSDFQLASHYGGGGNVLMFRGRQDSTGNYFPWVEVITNKGNQVIGDQQIGFISFKGTSYTPYIQLSKWAGSGSGYYHTAVQTGAAGDLEFYVSPERNMGSEAFTKRVRITQSGHFEALPPNDSGFAIGDLTNRKRIDTLGPSGGFRFLKDNNNWANTSADVVYASSAFVWDGVTMARTRINAGNLEYWNGSTWASAGGGIKSVQRGQVSNALSSAQTFNITIAAVNMNKSWVNLNHLTTNTSYTPVLARLTSSTNLQITVLWQVSASYPIDWEVIEGS